MKKEGGDFVKRIICALFSLAFIYLALNISVYAKAAENITTDFSANAELCISGDDVYLVDINQTDVKIKSLTDMDCEVAVSFLEDIYTYSYCNDKFYFYRYSKEDKKSLLITEITPHSYNGFYKTTAISDTALINVNSITADELGNIYLVDYREKTKIIKYDKSGKPISSYKTDYNVFQLFTFGGSVYVLCDNYLGVIDNGAVVDCGIEFDNQRRFKAEGRNFISDINGNIYKCSANSISKVFDVYSQRGKAAESAACDEYFLCLDGNVLYAYESSGKKLVSTINANGARDLACFNNCIYLLSSYSSSTVIDIIPCSELIPTTEQTSNTSVRSNSPSDVQQNNKFSLLSSVYSINENKKVISGIRAGTTVAKFRDNLDFAESSFSLYYNEKQRTSGKVGTGMTAMFQNYNNTYKYTLIVTGDNTGEGNVNSRDKNNIFSYLLGDKSKLSSVYFTSTDVNSDGIIDTKDLLLVAKMAEENN